jgi:hypothetical protein
MCDFKKGDKVIVWNSSEGTSIEKTFYAFDETLDYPFLATFCGRVISYRYCEKAKPKIAPGTKVLVHESETGINTPFRRYATGNFGNDGRIECWINGCDEWSSKGVVTYWKHWKLAEDEK